jgi:hypothetical protein
VINTDTDNLKAESFTAVKVFITQASGADILKLLEGTFTTLFVS